MRLAPFDWRRSERESQSRQRPASGRAPSRQGPIDILPSVARTRRQTRLELDDRLAALGLRLPGVVDAVEREALDVDGDAAGLDLLEQVERCPAAVPRRHREVRVADDPQLLAAHDGGRERRVAAGGLADVDGPCAGRRGLRGRDDRLAPERVDHDRRAVAAERLLEPVRHAVSELDDVVGAELLCALEPLAIAPGRDDARGAAQLRRLQRDRADRPGRAEDEHPVVRLHARDLDGRPAGDAGDPAGRGERGVDVVRKFEARAFGHLHLLCERAVALQPEPAAEDVDEPAVRAADPLAARDERHLRVATVEAPRTDGKVELRDTFPFGMLAVPLADTVRIHASSGTHGKPTIVAYTARDVALFAEVNARAIACAGGEPGDVLHVAYGYGLFTGGLGLHYGGERLGATVVPASGGNVPLQLELLADLGAAGLACTPSFCLLLAERARESGMLERIRLRYGVLGAEP